MQYLSVKFTEKGTDVTYLDNQNQRMAYDLKMPRHSRFFDTTNQPF